MKKTILLSSLLALSLAAAGCNMHMEEGFCDEICVDGDCAFTCDGDGGGERIPCDPDDLDCDGILDGDEARCNTSPELADTDGDGILDGDEDPDGDGYSNLEELAAGTNPADGSDAPGAAPADPAPPSPDVDTDGDGLGDADEARCNTSPELVDTDGDGILDGDEDPDGDGFTNLEEIDAGSDPASGMSVPGDCGPGGCFDPWGTCGDCNGGQCGNNGNMGNFNGGDVAIACASTAPGGATLPAFLLGALILLLPRLRLRRR